MKIEKVDTESSAPMTFKLQKKVSFKSDKKPIERRQSFVSHNVAFATSKYIHTPLENYAERTLVNQLDFDHERLSLMKENCNLSTYN